MFYLEAERKRSVTRSLPKTPTNFLLTALSCIYTFLVFIVACLLAPWLLFLFIGVKVCRGLWLGWLERRFEELEFIKETTPRTAVDTRRSQGIITVLLKISGPCHIGTIKQRIQEDIVDKKKKNGDFSYPHLRTVLTSRWGRYAWVRGSQARFCLDDHIIMGNSLFKGRHISHANIQEYVSDVVSKLLPSESPPWQVICVPTVENDNWYLLIRLHHLYLSEDGLALGQLLMLSGDPLQHELYDRPHRKSSSKPLHGLIILPQLYKWLCEAWSEFISSSDPLLNSTKPITPLSITRCAVLALVVADVVVREWPCKNPFHEAARRGLTPSYILDSVTASLSPLSLLWNSLYLWWLSITLLPSLIIHIIRETPLYLYWMYMASYAFREMFSIISILYTAPRVFFEEVLLPESPRNVHYFHTLSSCGRKVVSWSDPVPQSLVQKAAAAACATPAEMLLTATAASLRDYFLEVGTPLPEAVMTTSRRVSEGSLVHGAIPGGGPLLCLPLPCSPPPGLGALRSLQNALSSSHKRQAALYMASSHRLDYALFTSMLPSVVARAALYLLSRRYTVSLTQVEAAPDSPRRLIWGPRVDQIMYWRPPQANVCLALTLMNYGGQVQLGVMSDAQLSPHHSSITKSFSTRLYQLAAATGVYAPVPMRPFHKDED